MNILSTAALSMVVLLAVATSASGQMPDRTTPGGPAPSEINKAAPSGQPGTNDANPGYPLQSGGTYQGPPGQGAVIHDDDHRYNRT